MTLLIEGQYQRAVLFLGIDDGAKTGEDQRIARPQPLPGTREGAPAPVAEIADQQRLDRHVLPHPFPGPHALQPRRDDPGVVEHEEVAAPQQAGQGTHRAVVQRLARDVEQPRGVARGDRPLGDQIVRQREIEKVDAH